MKKFYSFIAAALMAAPAMAQTEVILVGPEGYTTTAGDSITITPEIYEEEDGGEIFRDVTFHAPVLRNMGSKTVSVTAQYNIEMPHGTFQDCIGGECYSRVASGQYQSSGAATIAPGAEARTLMEWNCLSSQTWDYEPGVCTMDITLYVDGKKGNIYHVYYVYDPTAETISHTTLTQRNTPAYTLDGRLATKATRGLVIQGGKIRIF